LSGRICFPLPPDVRIAYRVVRGFKEKQANSFRVKEAAKEAGTIYIYVCARLDPELGIL